ncbi:putative ribonuclease H-like domain-containing protein [Tanacetum coccineum]
MQKEIQYVHPPVSLMKHVAVQRENKVRTLLLQALPEDHMPDFHHYDDARDIWMAKKKDDRFQKILSQLNQVQARPDNDDINLKFLRALPSSWSQVNIYGVKVAAAPTHSALIGTAYNVMGNVLCILLLLRMEQDQDMIYERHIDHSLIISVMERTVIDKSSTSAFKVPIQELRHDDTKSFGPLDIPCEIGQIMQQKNTTGAVENASPYQSDIEETQLKVFRLCDTMHPVIQASRPRPKTSPNLLLISRLCQSIYVERPKFQLLAVPNPSSPIPADRPTSCWLFLKDQQLFRCRRTSVSLGDPSTDNDIGIVDRWVAPRIMTLNKCKHLINLCISMEDHKIWSGDGRISGKGTIRTSKLDFENVYYVEELQHFNLFSVSQICDKKNKVLFTDTDCLVLSEEFQLPDASHSKASLDESTRWHRRMAHVNFKTINKLAKEGKQHKASYKHISAVRLITDTLQLLHMDLFGPTNIRSIDQKYYSLVVTDDFSRFSWTFFLSTKDETFYVLKEFITLIENQLNKKVKGIRCDNGTEFKNAKLIELCGEKGIKRDYSNPRTPQQNGVAERKNRTLIEAARTMLADSKLPTMFWTEAVSTASDDGYLVGYASNSKAYRVYNLPNKRVEETLNLRFLEDKPNVQGIGTCTETTINSGTQDHDSDSEVDEQVIVIPSFPSNRFAGPSSSNGPRIMERNADYAEELAKLQRQEHEAKDAAARYGYLFSQATAEILCQAEAEIRDQAGVVIPAVKDSAGVDSVDGVSTGSPSADSDPAVGNPGRLSVSIWLVVLEPTEESNHASTLPPGQQLGSSENTTRFPVPSDVCMDQISSGIFTSSSYDDDFRATLTNLAPAVEVNPVPLKRVNTIHPQSQILGDLASPVYTRKQSSKNQVW